MTAEEVCAEQYLLKQKRHNISVTLSPVTPPWSLCLAMDVFAPFPPAWTKDAVHAQPFGCPHCGEGSRQAKQVWLNRRAPVFTDNRQRKWQEFYQCECETVWWGWSSDRPPLDLGKKSADGAPGPDLGSDSDPSRN